MKIISEEKIVQTVKELFIEASHHLKSDVTDALENMAKCESCSIAKDVLGQLRENIECAALDGIPVCQDTGMAVVFADVGMDCKIDSAKDFSDIINEGVRRAYTEGYLRLSVVGDPIERKNTGDNTPAIVHTTLVRGDCIKLTACPKGFGSENMSRIKMFKPTASTEEIEDFIIDTVLKAGSNPCPPVVLGIGVGGTFEYAALLAKKALIRPLGARHTEKFWADMEERLLKKINSTGIGPQGFGGDTTALGVNIEKFATHIAGLPVAVNVCCHVYRHSTAII